MTPYDLTKGRINYRFKYLCPVPRAPAGPRLGLSAPAGPPGQLGIAPDDVRPPDIDESPARGRAAPRLCPIRIAREKAEAVRGRARTRSCSAPTPPSRSAAASWARRPTRPRRGAFSRSSRAAATASSRRSRCAGASACGSAT